MRKKQRSAIYAFLSKTGYIFSKENRNNLKKLLEAEDEEVTGEKESVEEDEFFDSDENIEQE